MGNRPGQTAQSSCFSAHAGHRLSRRLRRLDPSLKDDRLEGRPACDNAAGVIGMLPWRHGPEPVLPASRNACWSDTYLAGNVGEEGEGDLAASALSTRHSPFAGRIAAHSVLEWSGARRAVTQASLQPALPDLDQRSRGHSFTDAGTVTLFLVLALALSHWRRRRFRFIQTIHGRR